MSIRYLKLNAETYYVIEIDNYVILNTLQNFYFQEHSIFVYQFGLKIFKTNTILIAKYLNLNWNIVKSSIFY